MPIRQDSGTSTNIGVSPDVSSSPGLNFGANQTVTIGSGQSADVSYDGDYSDYGGSYGDYGDYGGGYNDDDYDSSYYSGGYYGPGVAEAAAQQVAAAAAAAEKARNENLRRQNDLNRAQETRQEQAERRSAEGQKRMMPVSSQLVDSQPEAKQVEQTARSGQRFTPITDEEVSVVSSGSSSPTQSRRRIKPNDNTTLTESDVDYFSRASGNQESQRTKERGKPGRPKKQDFAESRIAELLKEEQEKIDTERKHLDDIADIESRLAAGKRLAARIREAGQGMKERTSVDRSQLDDVLPRFAEVQSDVMEELLPDPSVLTEDEAEVIRQANRDAEAGESGAGYIPIIDNPDTPWEQGSDITGLSGERAQLKKIKEDEDIRTSLVYESAREKSGRDEGNFDKQRNGEFEDASWFDSRDSEPLFQRKAREARNSTLRRYLNPSLIGIESEHVETRTETVNGKKRTFGRIAYSQDVTTAIGIVRRTYNCSIHNVMQLVMLRGGIGVDSKGTIAKVDPDKFKLTDDQFIELCRDIVVSQEKNGNPLGPVEGKPGGSGVRDDTGRFVVVAKTRCFPLGYMPQQLLHDLRQDLRSPLHQISERQIQKAIGEQWINETYPILCANTGGNLMFQARAIENMMRGLMMADGKTTSDMAALDIPELVEQKTLMALRAEEQSVTDSDIAMANEVKRQNIEDAISRWRHRWQKMTGSRTKSGDDKGAIESAGTKRRRNMIGDSLRNLNMLERAAKAANIGIAISNVPEQLIANGEQRLANRLSEAIFNWRHGELAKDYQFDEELQRLSQTKEAIEARQVAESLYRIGGHDAIDAFLGELGDDGRTMNRMTKADLRSFLQRSGVIGSNPTISDKIRQAFKIKPGEEAGFLSNVNYIFETLDNLMLGSAQFSSTEAKQFVRMSMAEMARASLYGRESYTSSQVMDWGLHGGGEEMIRSLLQTDAGREAFMTQGITSLGRKSPIEHQMRVIMAKNGLTEFAVRTMFDRFPEYGVNKVLQMIPFSNTISYLIAAGIKGVGDILVRTENMPGGGVPNFGNAMQRNFNYQAGSRTSLAEGFRKNLLYDIIMAGEKLLIAGLYAGIVMFLGGVQPPDDEEDKYTWSEWKIGSGEDAVPIKWAWWMDDISGVGFPLGMAWAICAQDGFSPESLQTATNIFINAVANFNSGTAVFDAIDLVNNFDQEWESALGLNIDSYNPSRDEWFMTSLEQGFWDLIGDLTPTFIGQLVPWSKDYIFADGRDAHTAGRVYDVGEGSKYSMEEAQKDYHTKQTPDYADYMRRRSAQTNILQAMFYDWVFAAGDNNSSTTGYKYLEQPLDTMIDPYVQNMYDKFNLDLKDTNLPLNQEERQAELFARAEVVCQWIDQHYQNSMQANLDGFVLNYDARVNCINYCYEMINQAWNRYNDATSNGWLDNATYNSVVQARKDTIDHYQNLINNYFKNDDIPWSLPRYVRQESDRETRYVDDRGNPMTFIDTLGGNAPAHAESYWYGNRPSLLPFTSPVTQDKGYNFETIPYWTVLDDDGNPVNDVGRMRDEAGNMPGLTMGRNEGMDVQELMWGGQGNNMKDNVTETLNIPREGVPTIGSRPWRIMQETFPESLKNLDADTVSKLLGIPSSLPKEDENKNDNKSENENNNKGNNASRSSGGRSYGYSSYGGSRSYYRGGGGNYYRGGGGSYYGSSSSTSSYNPKIYSTAKQVYSDRASGLSTRQPYKATNTYLRPNFYTKGSREAYKRSDI